MKSEMRSRAYTRVDMASKILRRSGVSVGLVCERLGWRPDWVVQVGVGFNHEECDVLSAEWPETKWIGFEPHPGIASKIKYPGQLINKAVGGFEGKVLLSMKSRHADGSSLKQFPQDVSVREVLVEVTTLDRHFQLPAPDNTLLWLDCEGSELNVLHGATEFLRGVEMINIEMTPKPTGIGWPSTVQVHDFLTATGFWLQWTHTTRETQYDAVYVRQHLFKPEYCICPFTIKAYNKVVKR
jgi:FkbM family methyltransferase